MSSDARREGRLDLVLPLVAGCVADTALEGASLVDDLRPTVVMADCRSGVEATGRPGKELRRRSMSAARSRKNPPEFARWKVGRGQALEVVAAMLLAAVDAVLRRRLSGANRSLSLSPKEPSLALSSGFVEGCASWSEAGTIPAYRRCFFISSISARSRSLSARSEVFSREAFLASNLCLVDSTRSAPRDF